VLGEVMNGPLDGMALTRAADVLDQQRGVHRVGMVEVLLGALINRQVWQVFLVVVLLQNQNAFLGKRGDDAIGDGGLARACAAANPDHQSTNAHGYPVQCLFALFDPLGFFFDAFSSITAWAAASRAIGTRKGEALT